jgi:acylphosphatase
VQSVAFRFHARQEATQLRLSGWVRNLGDGRVEFQVQGPEERVAEWLRWVAVGPPRARVDSVRHEPVEPESVDGFEIR